MDNQEFIETLLDDGLDNSTIIDFVETQNDEIVELRAKLAEMESQEPVAWVTSRPDICYFTTGRESAERWRKGGWTVDPLYAKPVPADQPARITEQDAREIINTYIDNKIGVPVNEWVAPLLNKLNSDREQVPAVAVPDGWKLVPLQPTALMLHEGQDAAAKGGCDLYGMKREILNAWGAMLCASPAPSHSQHSADQLDGKYENVCVKCERIFIGAKFDRECDACPDPCQSNEIKGE